MNMQPPLYSVVCSIQLRWKSFSLLFHEPLRVVGKLFYFNYCDIILVMFSLSSIPIALVPYSCTARLLTSEAGLPTRAVNESDRAVCQYLSNFKDWTDNAQCLIDWLFWKLFWIFGHGYIKFRANNICTIAIHKVNVKNFLISTVSFLKNIYLN